jgi:hypothetical protein
MATNGKKPTRVNRQPRGRPRALDAAKKKAVLAYIAAGGSQRMAAGFVGCHASTIRNEADRDPDFLDSLTRAEGQCAITLIGAITDAATTKFDGDWRAAAWLLERKFPQDFGRDRDTAAEQEPTQIVKILVENRHEAEQYIKMSSLMPRDN